MSVEFITGVPGSGKTYLAVKTLKSIYDKKNRLVLTNISIKHEYDDYLQSLDIDKLYTFAKSEYDLYIKYQKLKTEFESKDTDNNIELKVDDLELNNEDDPFEKYSKNYELYLKDSNLLEFFGGSAIFWDECQNDLGDTLSRDEKKVWQRFFSYHRHFDMDIYLITQDLSLVDRKIKHFAHKFYFAINASKRFFNNSLRFNVYCDYKAYEKDRLEGVTVVMKKEIFDFYDSGATKKDKSYILKKLIPILVILVLTIGFYIYKFSSKSADKTISKSNYVNVSRDINSSKDDDSNDDDDIDTIDTLKTLSFFCNLNICTLSNSTFSIPTNSFKQFLERISGTILYSSKITFYYENVYVSMPTSAYIDLMKYNFIERGSKHKNGSRTNYRPFNQRKSF